MDSITLNFKNNTYLVLTKLILKILMDDKSLIF